MKRIELYKEKASVGNEACNERERRRREKEKREKRKEHIVLK